MFIDKPVNSPDPLRSIRFKTQDHYTRVLNTEKSNLIRFYPLNETTGVTAIDLSANENGTYTSTTLAGGKAFNSRPCASFDGSNDSVYCDTNINADFNDDNGSLICAFKFGQTTGGILRYAVYIEFDGSNYVRMRQGGADNGIDSQIKSNAGGGIKGADIDFSGSDLDWHIWGITWNATSGNVKHYIDGTLHETDTGYPGNWDGAPTLFKIGSDSDGSGQHWRGLLAYVVLWDTDLSEAQMKGLTRL